MNYREKRRKLLLDTIEDLELSDDVQEVAEKILNVVEENVKLRCGVSPKVVVGSILYVSVKVVRMEGGQLLRYMSTTLDSNVRDYRKREVTLSDINSSLGFVNRLGYGRSGSPPFISYINRLDDTVDFLEMVKVRRPKIEYKFRIKEK